MEIGIRPAAVISIVRRKLHKDQTSIRPPVRRCIFRRVKQDVSFINAGQSQLCIIFAGPEIIFSELIQRSAVQITRYESSCCCQQSENKIFDSFHDFLKFKVYTNCISRQNRIIVSGSIDFRVPSWFILIPAKRILGLHIHTQIAYLRCLQHLFRERIA